MPPASAPIECPAPLPTPLARTDDRRRPLPHSGDTYQLFVDPYDAGAQDGEATRQTFRIETGFSQLLFAAPSEE